MRAIAVILLLAVSSNCFAFRVTPAFKEVDVKRGEKFVLNLNLTGTKEREALFVYVKDYYLTEQGGAKFDIPEEMKEFERFSAKKWTKPQVALKRIQFTNEATGQSTEKVLPVVELKLDETKKVSIVIEPPLKAAGEYYVTVHFRDLYPTMQRVKGSKKAFAGVYFAVAARINIMVENPLWRPKKNGKVENAWVEIIQEVQEVEGAEEEQEPQYKVEKLVYRKATEPEQETAILSKNVPQEKSIITFFSFQNTGNLHQIVRGEGLVERIEDGRIFDKLVLSPVNSKKDGALLLPLGKRLFAGEVARPLPAGEFIVKATFDYGVREKARDKVSFEVQASLAKDLKESMLVVVEPKQIKKTMKLKAMESARFTVYNLDFEPLKVKIEAPEEAESFLRIIGKEFRIPSESQRQVGLLLKMQEPSFKKTVLSIVPERGRPTTLPVFIELAQEEDAND